MMEIYEVNCLETCKGYGAYGISDLEQMDCLQTKFWEIWHGAMEEVGGYFACGITDSNRARRMTAATVKGSK